MTNKKLHSSLIFSDLIDAKLLRPNWHMPNVIINFIKIHDRCKLFTGNRINEPRNLPRPAVIPAFLDFPDLEITALSFMAKAFGYDGKNNLFKRLAESSEHIPNPISGRQFDVHRKLTAHLSEDIRKNIATSIDEGETVFLQLDDRFKMIRYYAKQTCALITRMAAKIGVMTVLQYVSLCDHRNIVHPKYTLF